MGTTPIRVAPVGVVHTATPPIQAHFTGIAVGWSTTTTNPKDITLLLDGESIAYVREPLEDAYEVTITAEVAEPLAEGLHSVVASSTTGKDYWTFEYISDPSAAHPAITDVWPLGTVYEYSWARTARFAVSGAVVETASASAQVVVDGTAHSATLDGSYFVSDTLPLSVGSHDVTATVVDGLGQSASRSWSYELAAMPRPPTIVVPSQDFYWVAGAYVAPYGTATVSDVDGLINGSQRAAAFDPATGRSYDLTATFEYVTYGVASDTYGRITYWLNSLPEGGPYVGTLSMTDAYGVTASEDFTFSVGYERPTVNRVEPYPVCTTLPTEAVALISDAHSGVDTESVGLSMDGIALDVSCEASGSALLVRAGLPPVDRYTSHTVAYSVRDSSGIEASGTWPFYYTRGPQFSGYSPPNAGTTATDTPLIGVTVDDPDAIALDTIDMFIDGQEVTPTVVPSENNKLVAISHQARIGSGDHVARVVGVSARGVRFDRSWSFEVVGFYDMSMSEANVACEGCHRYPTNTERVVVRMSWNYAEYPSSLGFDDVHNVNLGDRYHTNNRCFVCHEKGGLTVFELGRCDLCHQSDGTNMTLWPAPNYIRPAEGDHGGDYAYSYRKPGLVPDGWANPDVPLSFRIGSPRKALDCEYCHQVNNTLSPVVGPHDVVPEHAVGFGGSGCGACHDNILTREHAKPTSRSETGATLNCASCHESSIPTAPEAEVFRAYLYATGPFFTSPTGYWQSREFVPKSGKITTARAQLSASLDTTLKVQGRIDDGTWITGAAAGIYKQPDWVSSVDTTVTFAQPVEAIRFVFDRVYPPDNIMMWADFKLDEVTLVGADEYTCGSCHDVDLAHRSQHVTGLDARCAQCHGSALDVGHGASQDSSAGTTLAACADCHGVEARAVVADFSRSSCGDCHAVGHQQSFAASFSPDVYLDPRFEWTRPLPANVFADESWMPVGVPADAGCIVLGSTVDVSVSEAWSTFNDQMADLGWTAPSAGSESGVSSFSATLAKGDMRCAIILYAGDTHASMLESSRRTRAELIWWVVAQ